jgi:hypothetical protein
MIIFAKTVQAATNMKPKSEYNAGKEIYYLAAGIKTYF